MLITAATDDRRSVDAIRHHGARHQSSSSAGTTSNQDQRPQTKIGFFRQRSDLEDGVLPHQKKSHAPEPPSPINGISDKIMNYTPPQIPGVVYDKNAKKLTPLQMHRKETQVWERRI